MSERRAWIECEHCQGHPDHVDDCSCDAGLTDQIELVQIAWCSTHNHEWTDIGMGNDRGCWVGTWMLKSDGDHPPCVLVERWIEETAHE